MICFSILKALYLPYTRTNNKTIKTMQAIYRAMYKPEGMFAEELLCSTVLKAYEMLTDWHHDSAANQAYLTPYRGYYNRFKNGGIVIFSDIIEDSTGLRHFFGIEEVQVL